MEQWVGCFILTGQEAPQSNRAIRDDLFKKTMSGDGIAGRRPYGLSTKMFELVGWKRLECNKLMSFGGVTERNFPSILRRSLVWKPKARFFDQTFLSTKYPDSHLDGIFASDPSLKQKLISGPYVAAGIRLQHGFEIRFSKIECQQIIEDYASLGGDDGLTEETMRRACKLKPNHPKEHSSCSTLLTKVGVSATQDSEADKNETDSHEVSNLFIQGREIWVKLSSSFFHPIIIQCNAI